MFNIKCHKAIILLAIIIIFIFLVPEISFAQTVRVRSISLNTQALTLIWGKEEVLTATLRPNNATDRRIWWNNSNDAVLVVNPSGNKTYIRALNPGESVVTATSADGRYVARCKVTVIKLVTSIGIDQDLIQLAPGETFLLKAWVEPRDASDQGITWESSDNAVAGVNDTGMVKGVREGETRIIARSLENRDISIYATVRVSLVPPTTELETEEVIDEPPLWEEGWPEGELGPTGDAPNYLLYVLIAALVLAVGLLGFVLLRRSSRQPASRPLSVPVSGASGRLPVLKGISGLYAGSKFALNTGPVTIGRDQSAARVVYPQEYEQISRRHLTIHFDPAAENFLIEDTSSNGTYLSNGSRLQQHQVLPPGETLTLANTEETFIVELE